MKILFTVLLAFLSTIGCKAQGINSAKWITNTSATPSTNHYSLQWDFDIERLNAGFLFSGNAAHNTFYMWQLNLEGGSDKVMLRPHICINGSFTLLKETDITSTLKANGITIKAEDKVRDAHRLRIEVDVNVTRTYIDNVLVDTYQVPYNEISYGEFGIREYGNEACYFDNMLVEDLTDKDNPRTLISEDFTSWTALDGGLIVDGWIGIAGTTNWYVAESHGIPVFRRPFSLGSDVVKATLECSALGVYNVFVNGTRVDGEELKPGWTDYRKEIPYQSFDVTKLLHSGNNCLAAEVSNGWWAGDIAHSAYGSNTPLQFVASLSVELADGSVVTLPTDDSWMASTGGRVVSGDIYDGESFDATRSEAWKTAEFATQWAPATVNSEAHGTLFLQTSPLVKVRPQLQRDVVKATLYEGTKATGTTYGAINVVSEANSVAGIKLKKGQTLLVDMGQNMVGWVNLTAEGARGTTVTVRHGEMLNYNGDADRLDKGPGGSLWTYNLRTADAQITYVMAGTDGGETYHPTHSFMGFRYVEITADADVTIQNVAGQVVGSDIAEWGEFECSDADINQLYQNVWWGQRGNFLSIPTDCPQRDERLGWTGDTQIFSRTALYNSDAAELYRQWMRDMRNGQASSGAFRDIAPYCVFWGEGNSAWGDAGVIVPWTVYDMTSDKSILEENYDAMQAWMNFCANQKDGTYLYNGAGTSFGDWLAYEDMDARYISVCYYAYCALLMNKTAKALGKTADAEKYASLYDSIRAEWQARYVDKTTSALTITTQTAYLLALHLGLLPDGMVKNVQSALRQKIVGNDYKLSTGFVGTGILCTTLGENGMDDLAYDLLQQRQNPSWLYSIDQGATTVWERWDSYTIDGGFNKHPWNMNSFNHYSYGAVVEWLYAGMAGIHTPDYAPTASGESGWSHFMLYPHVDNRTQAQIDRVNGERVTYVQAKTATPYGNVSARWERKDDGRVVYTIVIPQGCTATVGMPLLKESDVVVEGESRIDGQLSDNRLVFALASGTHVLECVDQASYDAIAGVGASGEASSGVAYDLSGRRLASAQTHGIYIQDGQKRLAR